ncbi:GNAT family N-acetyltransferase [Paenibacillus marinisediminis]
MQIEKREEILKLVERISPGARDFVDIAMNNNELTIYHYEESAENNGVFCVASNNECDIAYVSFVNDLEDEALLGLIQQQIEPYMVSGDKELCFNIYGRNTKVIEFVRKMGFKQDIEGYILFYDTEDIPVAPKTEFIEKTFEDWMLGDFITLFEQGYYQLNKDNGWETDWYSTDSETFRSMLHSRTLEDECRSFWIEDRLVGAYIIDGNYIRDLVISPEFQNKGYGTAILAHCIRHLIKQREIKKVCLRVAKSNSGAIRFYKKNGFEELSCFSEHTFITQ